MFKKRKMFAHSKAAPVALGVLLVAATAVLAAATDAVTVENPDTHFYQRAAETNLAEIDGGMLAQQRSDSPAVKNFGLMMVKDHTAANHTLRDLAVANHVLLPEQPSSDQRAKRAVLGGLSGDPFDKAYVEIQILLHKDAIALFKEESASGDDLAARHYAMETLPTLQAHLEALVAMPAQASAASHAESPNVPTQPAANPAPSTPSPP